MERPAVANRPSRLACFAAAALLIIVSASPLRAQLGLRMVSAGNPYVRVSVSSDTRT